MKKIESCAKNNHVYANVDSGRERVELVGLVANVADVAAIVHAIIRFVVDNDICIYPNGLTCFQCNIEAARRSG